MRYRAFLITLFVAAVALCAGLGAVPALAFPSNTTPCDDCHSGAGATVAVVPVSNNGVTAAYNVTVTGSGALAWAVFVGPTRVAAGTGGGGPFSVPVGATYAVFGVSGPSVTSGLAFATITPAAPPNPTDTVAPTTFADAINSYRGMANIYLTAQDDPGGSGVAGTFYIIDGGGTHAGPYILVTGLGDHHVHYWSIDNAGNTEAMKTADIWISPASAQTVPKIFIRASASSVRLGHAFTVSGRMYPADPGDPIHVLVTRPGSATWSESSTRLVYDEFPGEVGLWKYGYTPVKRGTYRFRAGYYGDLARTSALSRIIEVVVR